MTTSESRSHLLTRDQVVDVILEQFDMRLSNAGDDVHLLLFSRFEAEAVRAALSDYRRSETAHPDSARIDFLAEITDSSARRELFDQKLKPEEDERLERATTALSTGYEAHRRTKDTPDAFRAAVDDARRERGPA